MAEPYSPPPYSHPADQYFESLVDYLRHLVDYHDVEETPELWRSGRDAFDALHSAAHDFGVTQENGNNP